jgi:hypothetical protein
MTGSLLSVEAEPLSFRLYKLVFGDSGGKFIGSRHVCNSSVSMQIRTFALLLCCIENLLDTDLLRWHNLIKTGIVVPEE